MLQALAKHCNAFFLAVQPSAIQSKWYGDTNKAVGGLFKLARRLSQGGSSCVIFIGEIPQQFPPSCHAALCMEGANHRQAYMCCRQQWHKRRLHGAIVWHAAPSLYNLSPLHLQDLCFVLCCAMLCCKVEPVHTVLAPHDKCCDQCTFSCLESLRHVKFSSPHLVIVCALCR